MKSHRLTRLVTLALFACALALVATGCGKKKEPTADANAASAATCTKAKLDTLKAGTLTIGTDKPAYPPYYEDNDPTNGKGFESAVAYGIADQLGFAKEDVKWSTVAFNSSYAPGTKDFDFDINQISKNPDREKAVDFSSTYYTTPQAVIALKGTDAAKATSLAELQDSKIGVQVGTTSLDAVKDSIKPTSDPQVFNDSNDVVSALKNKSVDAIVVDLPTALYLTAAEIDNSVVVGQFAAPGGDDWGTVQTKGSPLTKCISWAIDELRSSGQLKQITDQYLGGDTAKELN